MAPNECTTNPSTSSAMCRACFPTRRARAHCLAACRWSAGWAALATCLAEASHSLVACYSVGWAALAARLAQASSSLTACCSASWVALAARLAKTSRSLIAYCLAGWAALTTRMAEAFRFLTTRCCSAGLGCLGSMHGIGISFPNCLLLFSRMGYPGNTPGRGIPFPDCLLLFSPLHYTQSPVTVTHLSHTHYVCEAPTNNPLLLLLLGSYIVATHINSFSFSFRPSFFPNYIATTNNINSSWQPIIRCLILNPLLITDLIFWLLSKSYILKVGVFFFPLGWNQFSTLLFFLILWDFFLLCKKQTQWCWNPLRKRKKKKKLTLCETLSSKQLRKKLQGPLRSIFVEFLERSCTAEFSGLLL